MVASVRAQIYPDWELCLADDCSPDPQARVLLDEAAAADPRIKVVFREENGHIAAATNSAIDVATATSSDSSTRTTCCIRPVWPLWSGT